MMRFLFYLALECMSFHNMNRNWTNCHHEKETNTKALAHSSSNILWV